MRELVFDTRTEAPRQVGQGMASNTLKSAGRRVLPLLRAGAELIRFRTLRAPWIAAKSVAARAVWKIDVASFLTLGMYDVPVGRWRDSMAFTADLEPVLRMINWQGDGKRLTVDKLITAERLAQADIPSAPLIAVVGRDGAAHPHAGRFARWSTLDEIARALPSCPDRLFVKPATGWRGAGIIGPERHAGRWTVSGGTMSDRELALHLLETAPPSGLLVQDRTGSQAASAGPPCPLEAGAESRGPA
jgi:hypothetical protein